MKIKLFKPCHFLFMISFVVLSACNKDVVTGEDPYAGGKGSLGIGFITNYPTPSFAKPGELVDFNVKGIKPYLGNIDFFINGTPVEVVTAKDSLVTIKVPAEISSGESKIVVDGQVFYGPRLEIDGNTTLDENYGMVNGFNSSVYDILPNAGGFIVAGYFNNFENEAVDKKTYRSGIHFIDANGKTSDGMKFGKGVLGGGINSITKTSSGKFVLGGNMASFYGRAVYGITRINSDGSLDSMVVDVVNSTDNPRNSLDTVGVFNGGVLGGSILKVFGVANDKVIAVGNFDIHFKIDYTYSSRENRRFVPTEVKDVIRFHPDGSLDSAYALKNEGANGIILDAAMIDNERVVIVGTFTTYNGKPAPGIVCLKADGSVDPSISLSGNITRLSSVTYNAQHKKIAIAGIFSGAGASANIKGAVILHTDGTVDEEFVLGDIGTGVVSYVQVLNNGRVYLQGSMTTYNGIARPRMLILEKNGSLLQKYNAQAPFTGFTSKVIETRSSLGEPALLIGGSILQYGAKRVGNVLRVEVKE